MAKFLFILSRGTDDPVRATRCIHLAKVAKEEGHEVNIFLIEDGVTIAKIGMVDYMRSPTGDELKPLLDYLIKAEVADPRVHALCQLQADRTGRPRCVCAVREGAKSL